MIVECGCVRGNGERKRETDDSFQKTRLYLACRAANLSSLQARTTTRFPSNLLLCSNMSERMRSRPRSTTWSNRGRWGDQSTSWRVMTNSERRIRAKLHLYIGKQNIKLDDVRQSTHHKRDITKVHILKNNQ